MHFAIVHGGNVWGEEGAGEDVANSYLVSLCEFNISMSLSLATLPP